MDPAEKKDKDEHTSEEDIVMGEHEPLMKELHVVFLHVRYDFTFL